MTAISDDDIDAIAAIESDFVGTVTPDSGYEECSKPELIFFRALYTSQLAIEKAIHKAKWWAIGKPKLLLRITLNRAGIRPQSADLYKWTDGLSGAKQNKAVIGYLMKFGWFPDYRPMTEKEASKTATDLGY